MTPVEQDLNDPRLLREKRYQAWLKGHGMTAEEMKAQIRRNGSVPRPNRWLNGREGKDLEAD